MMGKIKKWEEEERKNKGLNEKDEEKNKAGW